MNNQDLIGKTVLHIKRSVTLKIISIGILILLLLIPAVMVQNLIKERQSRRDSVVNEINGKWGGIQTVTGPFITLPFKTFYKDTEGETQYNMHYLHILPETLNIKGEIEPQIRYRSLFEAVVYNAELRFSGSFKIPESGEMKIDSNNILWDKACVSLGITDMRGIRDGIRINFNGTPYNANPGLKTADLSATGVCAPVKDLSRDKLNNFSFDLSLKGSEKIEFIPVGKSNFISMHSTWPSPSFSGAFLPASREINKDGFSAAWKILHLNRNYPQFWEGPKYQVDQSSFGVKLILTADVYQKSMRLAKYSIMFIIFTFATFFFSDVINRKRIHPIQYILVGIAVLIFYVLVLSLSEHMNFNYAYIMSALSVTMIITGYARAIVQSKRFYVTVFVILIILYGYLFIVIQMEDYALIFGSIGLLIITAAVMFLTRRINWYADGSEELNIDS